jgi:anthranilate phosphoribosyltransferase
VALNAGAAIYAAGIADSHEAGVKQALEVISRGAAKAKLDQFIAFTQKLKT